MQRSEFHFEFYNAGVRHQEMMRFSISSSSAGYNADGNDSHSVGSWGLDAPKEDFFFVPSEIQSGQEVIRVNFAEDIKRRFGKIGMVLIDSRWDPAKENPDSEVSEYAIAPTRELAIKRGADIWELHLRRIVEGHLADCQNAMAAGGAPRAASGFTKKAFKLLGIADPGEQYFHSLKQAGAAAPPNPETNGILLQMQQQNQMMMAVVLAIAAGQKIDPELLEALQPRTDVPVGVTSGVGTGKINKPVGEFDAAKAGLDGKPVEVKPGQVGLDAYDRQTAKKTGRATAAEKELVSR